jgi:uncharacterized protein YukE
MGQRKRKGGQVAQDLIDSLLSSESAKGSAGGSRSTSAKSTGPRQVRSVREPTKEFEIDTSSAPEGGRGVVDHSVPVVDLSEFSERNTASIEPLQLAAPDAEDRTVPMARSHFSAAPAEPKTQPLGSREPETRSQASEVDRDAPTAVKTQLRSIPGRGSAGPAPSPLGFTSTEAALKQSEALRVAQGRLNEMEGELDRLRRDNERLHAAGETLRSRNDELLSRLEALENSSRESLRTSEEEKKVIRGQLAFKERENQDLRRKLEEMEMRLDSNFKKVRVAEKELRHRLEILKVENETLIAAKDKMLLDLKRQIDQLMAENEYGKSQNQQFQGKVRSQEETIQRVVRALRIALAISEGDDAVQSLKKNE